MVFFDLNRRYESLDEKGDPLVAIGTIVPFDSFWSKLKAAQIKGELRTMTEIWFYHLQRQPLESVLPNLIAKSLEKGWRVAVQARSEERLEALDSWLWTYSDESFLAHGRARDGDCELQPVYLTGGLENPNGAALRLFVEGAQMATALARAGAAYVRVVALFDGNNAEELAIARAQWKEVLMRGFPATYWQQNESGRWEKKS